MLRCTDRTRGNPAHRCRLPNQCLYTLNGFWSVYNHLEHPLKKTQLLYHKCTFKEHSTTGGSTLTVQDLIVSRVRHYEVVVRWPVQVRDVAGMSLCKYTDDSWTSCNELSTVVSSPAPQHAGQSQQHVQWQTDPTQMHHWFLIKLAGFSCRHSFRIQSFKSQLPLLTFSKRQLNS